MPNQDYSAVIAPGQRVKITQAIRSSLAGLIIPAGHACTLLQLTKGFAYLDVGIPCFALTVPLHWNVIERIQE